VALRRGEVDLDCHPGHPSLTGTERGSRLASAGPEWHVPEGEIATVKVPLDRSARRGGSIRLDI